MNTDSGEEGLERLSPNAAPLTEHDKERLDHALRVDRWRLYIAVPCALLGAAAPPIAAIWVVVSGSKDLDLPRVLLMVSALAFCGVMLNFADNMAMSVSARERLASARGGRRDRNQIDLVDALRTIVETLKEIMGKKGS